MSASTETACTQINEWAKKGLLCQEFLHLILIRLSPKVICLQLELKGYLCCYSIADGEQTIYFIETIYSITS